jgi:glutathione S-transferase
MVALLRYRRIPYCWIMGGHQAHPELPRPKVQLLPTFYLPDSTGNMEAVVDSTPLIRRFEREYPQRPVVPTDAALSFLDYLLEDYADEWLTKAMFHYRWHFAADIAKAREILPRWTARPMAEEVLSPVKTMIGDRQISRLYVVGSNATTAPVIEQSYVRYLALLRAHLESHPFLLGARPGASDFAA